MKFTTSALFVRRHGAPSVSDAFNGFKEADSDGLCGTYQDRRAVGQNYFARLSTI
jgi:hypothetical protein